MSKVIVMYKPQSEHARILEDYMRDFYRQTGRELETLDPDTREGVALSEIYDIVEYPTIIAVSDDGQILNSWRGLPPLPTISDLSYYN
jgi:hypothetical protein